MAGPGRFVRVLEPGQIGQVTIRNRIIKTAAESGLYNENDGFINDDFIAFHENLAQGGVGAVFVEGPGIDPPLSLVKPKAVLLDDDKYINGFSELTRAIHRHGCAAFLQLLHAGPWHQSRFTDLQPVAASTPVQVEFPDAGYLPAKALSIAEIEAIIDRFAAAAVRAQKAGFDGVDINAAAGHLLSTFLSRHWNLRDDAYGCENMDNRARIVVNIIREIKQRAGPDFSVGVVMNGLEYGGDKAQTIDESQGLARLFEQAGADSLHVRSYGYGQIRSLWPEYRYFPERVEDAPQEMDWRHAGAGANTPLAAAVKEVIAGTRRSAA